MKYQRPYRGGVSKILPRKEMREEAAAAPPPKLRRKRPRYTEPVHLRREAKDKCCQIQLPGCRGGTATEYTVLAHFRMAGVCGTALKPPDTIAAWGCDHCHAIVDGRAPIPDHMYTGLPDHIRTRLIRASHLEGMVRTLYWLHQTGYRMRRTP